MQVAKFRRTGRLRVYYLIFQLISAATAAGISVPTMWAAEPSISIHVSPIKDPVLAGSEIKIDVAVRNISTHDIRLIL